MNKKIEQRIKIPQEVARFSFGYFGAKIQWRNPFNTTSVIKIRNIQNELILSGLIDKEYIESFDIDRYLQESYTVEIKNISTGKTKNYSIAY